jgi:uncharacterized protein YecT (DUF1311 family)
MRAWIVLALVAAAVPATASDDPCKHAEKDPEFSACWQEQFKKSDAEIARRLRVLAERNRKDEPELHKLMTKSQQAWLAWREAACRVETFESKGTRGFSVYWDRCRITMNEARAAELQRMIDEP